MSTMTEDRIYYGDSDKGSVFLLAFGNEDGQRFEVRCGAHTIITTPDRARAERVAHALADTVPEPKAKPEPVVTTEATLDSGGVKVATKKK